MVCEAGKECFRSLGLIAVLPEKEVSIFLHGILAQQKARKSSGLGCLAHPHRVLSGGIMMSFGSAPQAGQGDAGA